MLLRLSGMCSVLPGLRQEHIRTMGAAWAQPPYAPYSQHSGLKVRKGTLSLTQPVTEAPERALLPSSLQKGLYGVGLGGGRGLREGLAGYPAGSEEAVPGGMSISHRPHWRKLT